GVSVLAALYPLLPAKRIVGSDVAHAVPLTLVGGLGHLSLGNVDPMLLVGLLCGSIPGILIGARLAGLAPEWLLRPMLAIMLCYAAYLLYGKI
ncbi:MAG TPA: sulfite exporter TauE/SafE family protein, partial [Methyloceanibacter sp.]|nr:sulfite exporter TauE/SafE family protein [Methyloceanibacter sp.]